MHVSAEDDAGLAQARHIVVTDLVTFAFRKAPESLGWHWPERRPPLHAPVPACKRRPRRDRPHAQAIASGRVRTP
ncbi:hypothetical protein PSM7751_00484 [Pseudooceanicola marinus]|uniref:Uncharacterized protein n=1 Tax=Pseudooceanicola marinus TaxID=396013 RepID=A0A1X6YBE6_9RHOB|nr:hypothetical protein PSM7751_00484 [Pseudooceanicola marinus]